MPLTSRWQLPTPWGDWHQVIAEWSEKEVRHNATQATRLHVVNINARKGWSYDTENAKIKTEVRRKNINMETFPLAFLNSAGNFRSKSDRFPTPTKTTIIIKAVRPYIWTERSIVSQTETKSWCSVQFFLSFFFSLSPSSPLFFCSVFLPNLLQTDSS